MVTSPQTQIKETNSTERNLLSTSLSLHAKISKQKKLSKGLSVPMKIQKPRSPAKRTISIEKNLQKDVIQQILTTITLVDNSNNTETAKKTISIEKNLQKDVIQQNLTTITLVDNSNNTQNAKSALAKHYLSTGHIFSHTDFQIILSDQHRYRLTVKESLLIRQRDPQLNRTERSLPLYIYPDGLTNKQKAISNINNRNIKTKKSKGMNDSHTNKDITYTIVLDPSKTTIDQDQNQNLNELNEPIV